MIGVETEVYPCTALDTQQQYVRVTLEIQLPSTYPDTAPVIRLRNPRGLDDSVLEKIEQQIREKCDDYIGQPVIFEIIEVELLPLIAVSNIGITVVYLY